METETMNLIVTSVAIPIAVALTGLLVAFISAKAEALKQKMKDERLKKYIDIANEAVITAVGAVSQTMVAGLKKAAQDGILSDDEAKAAFTEAKNRALAIMGEAGKEAVTELYGDLNEWITGKIEFYVGLDKAMKEG